MNRASIRKIGEQIIALVDGTNDDEDIDPHDLRVFAIKLESQAEIIEEGLHK
jgi:hypothetical protein